MSRTDWDALARVLDAAPGVAAAWVFGSAQDGQTRPGGDLDLAVLFAERPSLTERARLRAQLEERLQIGEIDLMVLNEASPIARFEALCGRLVCCRDVGLRTEFASLTAREYEDDMIVLETGMAYYKDRETRQN